MRLRYFACISTAVLVLAAAVPVSASDGGGGGGGGGDGSPNLQQPPARGPDRVSPPAGEVRPSSDRTWTPQQWDEFYAAEIRRHARENSLEYFFTGTARMRRFLERTERADADYWRVRDAFLFASGQHAWEPRLNTNKERMRRLQHVWRTFVRWRAHPNEASRDALRALVNDLGPDRRFVEQEIRRFSR